MDAAHDPKKCDGCGEAGYDLSIHTNPDAQAWAAFFTKHYPAGCPCPDEDTMRGWFANAMMAMHDFMENKRRKEGEMAPAEKGLEMDDCTLVIKGKDKSNGTPFELSLHVAGPFKVNVLQTMTYKEIGDPVDSYGIKLDLLKIYTPEEMKARQANVSG